LSHLTKNIDDSARVRGVEVDILAVGADAQQGQELAPKISAEIEKQDHSVLHASPTVGDDRALVSSRLFQGDVLVRAEEESEYNPPAALDPDDNQWAVEKLIEKRRIGRAFKYLVKWLGYPDSENSWERKKDIDPDIIAAFEAELLLAQD
jgi:Chromo (CHRromatin Organisation MOdifier) domain